MGENTRVNVDQLYNMLCNTLDKKGWKYAKQEERQQVIFITGDENIALSVGIGVEERKQRMYLQSPWDIKVNADKRFDIAIATCKVNAGIADGCLDYDVANGRLGFRISASLWESKAGEGLIDYMIGSAYAVATRYSETFDKLNKGEMSIEEFLAMH